MAKKNKRSKSRRQLPRQSPVAPTKIPTEPLSTSVTEGATVNYDEPVDTSRRRVERREVLPQRGRPLRGAAAAAFAPLENEDAAIPFDRVPYVPADLKRVAVMAIFMIILIVVFDIVISRVAG
jgi:hypothetical protein